MMKKLYSLINKYFKLFLILLSLISVGMGLYLIYNLKMEQDITKLIPSGKKEITHKVKILDKIGLFDQFLFDISFKDEKDPKAMIKLADQFVNELKSSGHFKSIFYKMNPSDFQKLIAKLFNKRYALIRPSKLTSTNIYSDQFIKQRLEKLKAKLLSFESLMSKQFLLKDPLGLTEQAIKDIMAQNLGYKVKLKNNILFSKDGKHILIITKPKKKSFDIDFTQQMLASLNPVIKQFDHQNVNIKMLGAHLYAYTSANTIKNEITFIFCLSIIGIILIYLFSFKRLQPLVLSFIPIVFGILAGLFAVILLYDSIHGITIVFGATLIGICIDYSTHYFTQLAFLWKSANEQQANFNSIDKIKKSLLFGYITTIVVFVVFLFSDLKFIKEISIFSFVGITMAFLLSVFIVPQFNFKNGINIGYLFKKLYSGLNFVSLSSRLTKTIILGIVGLSVIASGYLIVHIDFDTNISSFNYVEPKLKKIEQEFFNRYGDISTSHMIFIEANSLEELLNKNDSVYQILKKSKEQRVIESFYNIQPFLPSIKNQTENIKHLLSVNWKLVQEKMAKILPTLGFKATAFEAFFNELTLLNTKTFPYISLDDMKNSPFSSLLDELMSYQNGKYTLLSYFKTQNDKSLDELTKNIGNLDKNIYYINQLQLINTIIQALKFEMLKLILIGFIVICIVLLILYKDIKKTILAMSPSLFGILITGALFSLFDYKVNVVSVFSVVLIVGIGLDYGIFMCDSSFHQDKVKEHTSIAIIIAAITTILSFGILILSKNKALSSIGVIILSGISLTMLFSILIIPILVEQLQSNKR